MSKLNKIHCHRSFDDDSIFEGLYMVTALFSYRHRLTKSFIYSRNAMFIGFSLVSSCKLRHFLPVQLT